MQLRDLALKATYRKQGYYIFSTEPLGPKALEGDPVLSALQKHFDAPSAFFRFPPNTLTNWHRDARRSCAVNILLAGTGHTLFHKELTAESPLLDIEELEYEPGRMYLLDTKREHAVLNLEGERYIFTMSLRFDSVYQEASAFPEVLSWCREHNLINPE